jgi:gamma-glutamyltranspeptidase/glutathione hydrolase
MKERSVYTAPRPSLYSLTILANYTVNAIQSANGTMTLDDLKNYRVSIRKPIEITYRGYKLFSTGAPSGGSVALSILKIIEGYDMSDPSTINLNLHRLDEAMRFAYGARAELGDPAFFNYMDDFEAAMLKPTTAEEIRRRILDDRTQDVKAYDPKGYLLPESHGTSHIVTADASGMTITLTSTVNLLFGSRVVVPETGKPLLTLVLHDN